MSTLRPWPAASPIPHKQDWSLAVVAEALARTGHYERAEAVIRSLSNPYQQTYALVGVAEALAGAGQHEQAAASRAKLKQQSDPSPTCPT